jgi:alpha-tubulin suppressor-like RCC1 family protein
MVDNTGPGWIRGAFPSLAQGGRISLPFAGKNYDFVVNYFGGTGNDLVLQWADNTIASWGSNGFGQLGDGTTERRLVPVAVGGSGSPGSKSVMAVAGGYLHSLALLSDGSVLAWGHNSFGQLGNGLTSNETVPMAVESSGALAGRTVVAIAAGAFHNLALCSDGGMVAWGYNNHGQLGDGTRVTRRVPVAVPQVGALAGKRVVALAAGAYQSFALCEDGTVAAWGYNDEGQLGDGGTVSALIPVAVKADGVLAGRRIISLAAGQYHTLGLCADGGVVSWGYNARGQLGDSSTADSLLPVDLRTRGVLAGRLVKAVAAGSYHSVALCSDGTLAVWGYNHRGQLGTEVAPHSAEPTAILADSAVVSSLGGGANHNLMLLASGQAMAWGDNTSGQLGDGTMVNRAAAVDADFGGWDGDPGVMFISGGSAALHSLAVIAREGSAAASAVTGTVVPGDDLGDPDGDRIPNLLEYAFGLNPLADSSGKLPQARIENGELVIHFAQPSGVSGVTYGAEWSESMQEGSWLPVADSGESGEHRFAVPVSNGRRAFIRLKVTKNGLLELPEFP